MFNRCEVIGVDTGYGFIKTRNHSFPAGLCQMESEPLNKTDVLEYKGKYYILDSSRYQSSLDREEDPFTYLFSLVAIAKELKTRGVTEADVVLSVGLPIERCNKTRATKLKEISMMDGREVFFSFDSTDFHIYIQDIVVNPQCLSAVVKKLDNKEITNGLVVDMGSRTIDILPFESGNPVISKVISLNLGVNEVIAECNTRIRQRFSEEISESVIQDIMRKIDEGTNSEMRTICEKCFVDYCQKIAANIRERHYNLNFVPCYFIGGGAAIIQNYGKDFFPVASYDNNIRANAIGYEIIANNKR